MPNEKFRYTLTRDLTPQEVNDLASSVRARSPAIFEIKVDRARSLGMSEADIVITIIISVAANLAQDLGLNNFILGHLKKIGAMAKVNKEK